MVCRGGPWKVPWYAVEDADGGFAAGGVRMYVPYVLTDL